MNQKPIFFLLLFVVCFSCQETKDDPYKFIKPEESRFTKVALVEGLNEPMELEVLSNGDVLFIERNGKLRRWEKLSGDLLEVGFLEVYPDGEDGLLGLAKDPAFDQNQWIYLYYAPLEGNSINRLSRFTLTENLLDRESEKILLEVPVFRGCCHSGGSLEFDSSGNLYLSLGDDSTPFESDDYNPIDERSGRPKNVDAQRSSSNSNDLRGSIIKITPQSDGTYTIPDGNLFPVGTANARPEIYVMGNRNPYRISVDQRNGNLFWGEVGPDASKDSLRRGPKGHDEINLAKKAGFFGWPYFVGNNKPYWKYDFEKQESLFEFDPMAPENTSPNNTGLAILPKAMPALIWYPYGESPEFPMLGEGGRNAMAGPVFYRSDYEDTELRFPGYFDEKLFIFDWMRNWIFTVSLTENYEYDSMERFMPSTVFDKPVDLQFGPDGALYMLEYGTYWRAQNDDSGLYRIEFASGNRKPKANISASKRKGELPLKIDFSSKGSLDFDPDDELSFEWDFGDGGSSTDENPSYSYTESGIYEATLRVTDKEGFTAEAKLEILAGNSPPAVSINWDGNQSFYFEKDLIPYAVEIQDKEDEFIEASRINFSIDYLEGGFDLIQIGHQEEELSIGETYINEAGCKACHAMENESVGPSYSEVSEKYSELADAKVYLMNKIIKGGGGVWGERVMPGHSHLDERQVEVMVDFILGLSKPDNSGNKLPLSGTYSLNQKSNEEGYYLIQASYTDAGANGIPPLMSRDEFVLRNPLVKAESGNEFSGAAKANTNDDQYVKFTENNSWVRFESIDLNQIRKIVLELNPGSVKGKFELRQGSLDGPVLGSSKTISRSDGPSDNSNWLSVELSIQEAEGIQDLYLVFNTDSNISIWNTFNLNSLKFIR